MQVPPLPAAAPSDSAARHKIAEAAQAFEASMLSSLMQSMFEGVGGGAFSGGEGERQFRSVLVDAMAKQAARSGGVGVADQVAREMLKLQGLSEETAHVA